MAKDLIDRIADKIHAHYKSKNKDIPNQIGANIPNQVGATIRNQIYYPKEGMGGYGGKGDAERKRYIEKITNGEG